MFRILLILLCSIFLTNCANNPFSSYKTKSDNMLNAIKLQENHMSLKTYGGDTSKPDILFFMEYGTFLKLNNDYSKSNIELSHAQLMVESWVNSWQNTTGGSVLNTSIQVLLNDNATDYEPKGYEKTMLATYKALNNISLGNSEFARIEIKRMYQVEQAIYNYNLALYNKEKSNASLIKPNSTESKLYQEILKKYNFDDISSPEVLSLKNSYQVAYAHYLAGFIFEALHELSLSRPGYLKSGQLNPSNKLSQQSIDNLDKGVNNKFKKNYSDVLIIEEVGHAPQIKSENIHFPFFTNINGKSCLTNINVFYPKLVTDRENNKVYNYKIDNNIIYQELYTNFDLMLARAIHDNMPHIIMRNVTSAARSVAMSTISCEADSSILNLAGIVTGVLLDHADERTWVLLPSRVYLSRVQLPMGRHKFSININGRDINKDIIIDRPYQIVNLRVLGDNIYM